MKIIGVLTISFSLYCVAGNADELKITNQLVTDSKRLCVAITNEGLTKGFKLKGNARAELGQIIKKLGFDVGVDGDGEYIDRVFKNVTQEDLPAAIVETNKCNLEAFRMLKEVHLELSNKGKILESEDAAKRSELEIELFKLKKEFKQLNQVVEMKKNGWQAMTAQIEQLISVRKNAVDNSDQAKAQRIDSQIVAIRSSRESQLQSNEELDRIDLLEFTISQKTMLLQSLK